MSEPVQILMVDHNPVVKPALSQPRRAAGCGIAGARRGAEGYIARPIENRELVARLRALSLRLVDVQEQERRALALDGRSL